MSGQLRTPFGLVPEWVDESVTDGTAMRLYVRLARKYANAARDAFPEEITLAEELGVSERTIRRCLAILTDAGAIRITRTRRADGHYGRNLYHLPMDEPGDHRPSVTGGPDQEKPDHHRSPVAGGPPVTSDRSKTNQTQVTHHPDKPLTPSSNSDEFEGHSARAHTHTHTRDAHARPEPSNPSHDQGQELALLEAPGPGVVSITSQRDASFERFWAVYPRKVGKQDARRAWDKAVKTGPALEVLIASVGAYAAYVVGDDPRFTKHPATWLRGGCWDDELPARNARASGSDNRGGHQPFRGFDDDSIFFAPVN